MLRHKVVSRGFFPIVHSEDTVCSTVHTPKTSPAQFSPVSIVSRYTFQNMFDHKKSYPEVAKGGVLSGVGHTYSLMQVQVSGC